MNASDRCIRCDGELEEGFLVDKGHYDVAKPAQWASGRPEWSFWRSSSVGREERTLALTTYRCTRCGRLESFARGPGP